MQSGMCTEYMQKLSRMHTEDSSSRMHRPMYDDRFRDEFVPCGILNSLTMPHSHTLILFRTNIMITDVRNV